jgi:uncharacterized protein (TIGR00251 family)
MRFSIRVIPNAKHEKIIEEEGKYKIYLSAPAVEGKANKALIQFLAEHFKTKRNKISIIRGEKSREKIVEIGGL